MTSTSRSSPTAPTSTRFSRSPPIKRISGFTTNPTLMWKAGLTDYEEFAKRLLERITTHPISFEVFADDADEMRRQANLIVALGRERLRQDPRVDDPRRVDGAAGPGAVGGRRQGRT